MITRRWILGLACALPMQLAAQTTCGVDRWPVKIWTDRDAARVDTIPTPITVNELRQIPRPDTPHPNSNRVGAEFRTYVVRARVKEVRPQTDDSDLHVVVSDPENDLATMVTEIPHPECAMNNERLARVFAAARDSLRTVPRDGLVEITGIAFFDSYHGQRGMAPNGIEIHPVLLLRPIDRGIARPSGPVGLLSSPPESGQVQSRVLTDTTFADTVWVNSSSGVYHCRGTLWYGRTIRGSFMTEREARTSGARSADGRSCGPRAPR